MALNSNKFFDSIKQDVTVGGTLFGRRLTKEERIEGHKTKDPIKFKSFVTRVLNKKGGNGGSDITGRTLAPVPSQRLLPGAMEGDEPIPAGLDSLLEEIRGEGKKKRKKSLLDWVKQINTRVGGIITILTKQSNIDKDNADKERQELEKDARADRESGREGKPKMGLPGPVKAMLKPVSGLWENILKTIGILFKGWALNNFLKWLGDPKNAENVKAFTDLIVRNIPNALKAIGVIVGAGLITKLITFTAGIIAGSLRMVNALFTLGKTIFKFGRNMMNFTGGKQMALFFGLASTGGDAAFKMQEKEIEKSLSDTELTGVKESIRSMDVITGDEVEGVIEEKLSQRENFNEGGVVPGSGNSDTVPAMLTPGEFVMSAGAVNEWGLGTLANMNAVGGGNNSPQYMGGTLFANGGGPAEIAGIAEGVPFTYLQELKSLIRRHKWITEEAMQSGEGSYSKRRHARATRGLIKYKDQYPEVFDALSADDKKYINSANNPLVNAIKKSLSKPRIAEPIKLPSTLNLTSNIESSLNNISKGNQSKSTGIDELIKKENQSKLKDRTSNQLINNPPGSHGKSSMMKLPPLTPSSSADGGTSSGGAVPTEPMFSPHDKSNHYTLLNASMCNILGSK